MIAGSCISAREASAAMALITAATEPEHEIMAFSAAAGGHGGKWGGGEPGITRVNLSPRMRLADVIKRIEAIPMGGTDCALPMVWAARNKLNVSASSPTRTAKRGRATSTRRRHCVSIAASSSATRRRSLWA